MTVSATSHSYQEFAPLDRVGEIGCGHGRHNRSGHSVDQIFHWKNNFSFWQWIVSWRKRAQKHDNGSQILVGHLPKPLIGHQRKQGAAVVANSLANGAGQRVIAPLAGSGFRIGSEVGSNDAAWQSHQYGHILAGAFHPRGSRRVVLSPIVWGVAIHASADALRQVFPARQALRSALEDTVGKRPGPRTKERPPSDRKRYPNGGKRHEANQNGDRNFYETHSDPASPSCLEKIIRSWRYAVRAARPRTA